MTSVIANTVAVVLLLAANAFFVAAEFALVRVRRFRMEARAEAGSAAARLTLRMLDHLEAYLAACQLGITMASLGLGWVGEPAVAALLEPLFRTLGLSEVALHTVSFLVGFLLFSSLHIVVGEQVPKTFAIRQAEPMALAVAYPLQAFYLLWFPLNWALNRASQTMLSWFKVEQATHGDILTSEELRKYIVASRAHGGMRKQERDMLGGILDLADVEVSEIMTHRKSMETIDADSPIEQILEQVVASPHSRLPVWRGDPDSIIGVLHDKDLLAAVHRRGRDLEGVDLTTLFRPPWFVPDTTPLRKQLVAFRQRRQHLALVVNEYGDLEGLVTLEDVIEEIVGEISDERDVEPVGIEALGDGSVLVSGWITLRDLNRQFDWKLPDEEAATVAGLVIHEAQRIPEVGQSFAFHGFRFEVLRRQRNQIVLLKVIPPAVAAA
ncbi:MAG TPA: hemolysin family protein [Geminicoccaceae bacterium]|nr:hemolysin family protein [Geminicoccaceae bacterium]